MDDHDVIERIDRLVQHEHRLRQRATGEGLDEQEEAQLRRLEVALDQCWDLLRQRRVQRNAGEDPADAAARPERVVEGYQQ